MSFFVFFFSFSFVYRFSLLLSFFLLRACFRVSSPYIRFCNFLCFAFFPLFFVLLFSFLFSGFCYLYVNNFFSLIVCLQYNMYCIYISSFTFLHILFLYSVMFACSCYAILALICCSMYFLFITSFFPILFCLFSFSFACHSVSCISFVSRFITCFLHIAIIEFIYLFFFV